MLTTTETFDLDFLTALLASAELWGNSFVGLYTNVLNPTKTLTLDDIVEPTDPGYQRWQMIPFQSQRSALGIIQAIGAAFFSSSPWTVPVNVQGIFITYGTVQKLMAISPLPIPLPLIDTLNEPFVICGINQSSDNPGFTTLVR